MWLLASDPRHTEPCGATSDDFLDRSAAAREDLAFPVLGPI